MASIGFPRTRFGGGKHQTLEESAYHFLRQAIVSGEYAPGTKLVGSRLAAELHVSRLTIANAMKRLISEGFAVGTPHHESVVASLDEKSLREIFLIRHALEDVVMQEATKNVSPVILIRLRELNEQLRASIEQQDTVAYRRIEREYHLLIYAASELSMMAALLTDLWDRFEPYRGRRYSNLRLNLDAYTDHQAIHEALEARAANKLVTVMRAHVDQGYERFRLALGGEIIETGLAGGLAKPRRPGPGRKVAREEALPGSLRAALVELPDTRRGQGKMHGQSSVLTLAVCAMLCGVRSRYGIAWWGQNCHPSIRSILGLPHNQGPSIATVHRLFSSIDQAAFEQVLLDWFKTNGVDLAADTNPNLEEADLEGLHGGKLPGIGPVSAVARRLQATWNQQNGRGSSQQPIAELPMLLLAGKATTATALLAQRELMQQIILQNGKVTGSARPLEKAGD
jgi:DNA-binding GntR family transcriptional regulator